MSASSGKALSLSPSDTVSHTIRASRVMYVALQSWLLALAFVLLAELSLAQPADELAAGGDEHRRALATASSRDRWGASEQQLRRDPYVEMAALTNTAAYPSDDLRLESLSLSSGTMMPAFSPEIATYGAEVESQISSITLSAAASDASASVTVNGRNAAVGETTAAMSLPVGVTTLTVTVLGEGGIDRRTYILTVNRAASAPDQPEETHAKGMRMSLRRDATRSLRTRLAASESRVSEARERFIKDRRMDASSVWAGRRRAYDLNATGTSESLRVNGKMFALNVLGGWRRLVSVDSWMVRESGGSTIGGFSIRATQERVLREKVMLGVSLGLDAGRGKLTGPVAGARSSVDAFAGVQGVIELGPDLFLEGFATIGIGQNSAALRINSLDVDGEFSTRSAMAGASLTGVIERSRLKIMPQIAVTYGQTRLGRIQLAALEDQGSVSLDAGTVYSTRLRITPELRIPLTEGKLINGKATLTLAPRSTCEWSSDAPSRQHCGSGGDIGFTAVSADKLSQLRIRAGHERIGPARRRNLGVEFERRF